MSTTRISHRVNAPCAMIYRALRDARAVSTWRVPTGMTSQVHAFEGRGGGRFRISLTCDAPTAVGGDQLANDTDLGRSDRSAAKRKHGLHDRER